MKTYKIVIPSEPPSKELHEYEQNIIEVEHFIKALTLEGETVFDPFTAAT